MELSPRQRFLNDQEAFSLARHSEIISEEDVAEISDVLDNVDKALDDQKKCEMTLEQHQNIKAQNSAFESLDKFTKTSKPHLSKEQGFKLNEILEDFKNGIIVDATMMFLIKEKMKFSEQYLKLTEDVKNLQLELFKQITTITTDLTKTKGVIEAIDHQILGLDLPLTSPED